MIRRQIDFYTRYRRSQNKVAGAAKKVAVIVLPYCMLFAVCTAIYLVLHGAITEREDTLTSLTAYCQDPENIARYDACLLYDTRIQELTLLNDSNAFARNAVDSYPRPNSAVIAEIMRHASANQLTAEMKSYASGGIQFTAYAAEVTEINQFVSDLLESELFASVDYSGYTYTDHLNQYRVNVSCVLAESAGK